MKESRRCSARSTRHGGRCRKAAMRGQRVCRNHGGASPQALRTAEARLEAAKFEAAEVDLATMRQRRNPELRFRAARDVLDRTGVRRADCYTVEQVAAVLRTVTRVFLEVVEDTEARRRFAAGLRRLVGGLAGDIDVTAAAAHDAGGE